MKRSERVIMNWEISITKQNKSELSGDHWGGTVMYFQSMRTSSYVADCTEYLTGCKSGKYSSHEQWEGLLRHANEIFHYGW